MEIKITESPGQEWDEFASRYTDLIFYQSIWSEVLKRGLGGKPLYFYLKDHGEIVAGLPGIFLNLKIIKVLYASIPYGNFIGEKRYFPFFLELIKKELPNWGIDQIRITECPFFESYRGFEEFTPLLTKCTLLNLEQFKKKDIRENFRGDIKRAIKKAEKVGLYIKKGESHEELRNFYRLYLSSMERNQAIAKYPFRWFCVLYELLVKKNQAEIIFALKPPEIYIAGVFLIISSSSLHYLHNGSERSYWGDRPNDFIIHYIIQEGIKKNKSILDFMGSDPMDFSLIRFKEKWGGDSKDIFTFVKNLNATRCKIWEIGMAFARSSLGRRLAKIFW